MVAVSLSAFAGAGWQFLDANGAPLELGYVNTYAAGTTTPATTYTSNAGGPTNTNPIALDGSGRPPAEIWLVTTANYKFVVTDHDGANARTFDNIPGIASAADLAAFIALIEGSSGSDNIGYERAGAANNVVHSVQDQFDHDEANLFEWLSDSDIASVQGYSYSLDLTTKIQNAINESYALGVNLYVPAGGYLVSTLTPPGSSATRGKAWRMYGQGPGEIFAQVQSGFNQGTVFKSVTDASVLKYVQNSPNTGNGTIEIDHITFAGNTATAYIVDLQSNYEQSSFHHCNIYNAGDGGGFKGDLIGSSDIYQNYAINADWNTGALGAARTGIGFLYAPGLDLGLGRFEDNHARGWHDGYIVGGGVGRVFNSIFEGNEVSICYNGITVSSGSLKTNINANYMEGIDGGTSIINNGDSTTISNNTLLPGATCVVDDSSTANIGTLIEGNIISLGSVANAIGVKIASTGAFGGSGKIVRDNYIVFSGSGGAIVGVNGIKISGIDPRLTIEGNAFSPRGLWVGGAGTIAINDISTCGTGGTTQTGVYGVVLAKNGAYEFPLLSRGAIGIGEGDLLGDASVVAGVFSPGITSWAPVTLTGGGTNITSFQTGLPAGLVITVFTTNAIATFVHSANLIMAGATNYTPSAAGAVVTFRIFGTAAGKPIAREVSRTAF